MTPAPVVRRQDLAFALAYGLLGTLFFALVDVRSPLTGGPVPVWVWLPCVVAGVLLVTRRRAAGWASAALGALVVLLFALNAGPYGGLLLFEVVYGVAVWGGRRARLASWLFGAALVAAVVVALVVAGAPAGIVASGAVVTGSIVLLAAWWGANVHSLTGRVDEERARARAVEVAAAAELEAAEARQELAIAQERARFGSDMHDLVAGRLAAIALQSRMALPRTAADPRTHELVGDIHECAAATLAEVRALIEALAGGDEWRAAAAGDPRASLAALVRTTGTLGARIDVRDELGDAGAAEGAGPGALEARALYVMAQEVVVNMFRHAPSCRGELRLYPDGGDLVLDARNDLTGDAGAGTADGSGGPGASKGPGGPAAATGGSGGGHGLENLRRRVAPLGGTVAAGPDADGTSWRVHARIPLGVRAGDRIGP